MKLCTLRQAQRIILASGNTAEVLFSFWDPRPCWSTGRLSHRQ
jgi:hypothetical protein